MKKLFISFLFIASLGVKAQDLQFSQFFGTSLYLNPAFSAVYVDPTVFINYRRPANTAAMSSQASQISATYPLLIDPAENTPRAGAGVMAYSIQDGPQGIFKKTGILLNYAHNFSIGALNTEVIAVGIQGGYENLRLDVGGLSSPSDYSPYSDENGIGGLSINEAVAHPIINAGIMYYYNRERNFNIYNYSAFSGFAVTNLNRPNISFSTIGGASKAPMLLKYHGGIEFKAGKMNIMPNILVQFEPQQGNFQADGGIFSVYSVGGRYNPVKVKLIAGAWYRLRDAFILLGGINYNALSIKVSYDMNTNLFFDKNVEVSTNFLELSLQYNIANKDAIRKISNPLF